MENADSTFLMNSSILKMLGFNSVAILKLDAAVKKLLEVKMRGLHLCT